MSGPATASGERLVRVVGAARAALEARAGEIDDLNVFPVADGDTGTNMLITAVAVEQAAAATTGLPWPERCAALARAALMGARGNSGMILSQLVRGAAESLAGEDDLGGPALARALRRASETAYAAVRHPVEGTMLTVARRTAEGAEAAEGDGLEAVLDAALEGGRRGVAETPELLAVLREAGVVELGRARAWSSCWRAWAPGCWGARSPRPSTWAARASSRPTTSRRATATAPASSWRGRRSTSTRSRRRCCRWATACW